MRLVISSSRLARRRARLRRVSLRLAERVVLVAHVRARGRGCVDCAAEFSGPVEAVDLRWRGELVVGV